MTTNGTEAETTGRVVDDADADSSDTLRIFVATDNHLGFLDKDAIRANDSFRTFEEILQHTKRTKADFLLLGGDLFHHNKPSRSTMHRTMNLLRKYCQGDGDINFRIVSDQSLNFPDYGLVNFEDPNVDIEVPVFCIHGNHDDPVRDGFTKALSALDLLSAARLLNYFGQTDKVDDIELFPILMMKGETKVAIYGLGNLRDERLNRMFTQKKVRFRRPAEFQDDWFNIFVVHQNRANKGRGTKNCIDESFIPDFIDFVIWGHEHECLIDPQESMRQQFMISQPGSSVATSLVEGEAREKKVGLLEIRRGDFRYTIQTLETVRPFVFQHIVLSEASELDPNDPKIAAKLFQFLTNEVSTIILRESSSSTTASNSEGLDSSSLILLRLRIEYSGGFPTINNNRFGSQFVKQVANPDCILQFYRSRGNVSSETSVKNATSAQQAMRNGEAIQTIMQNLPNADAVCVEDLISKVFEQSDNKLNLLPETELNVALENFVYKSMSSSVEEAVSGILESTQSELHKVKEATSTGDIQQLVGKTMERLEQQQRTSGARARRAAGAAAAAAGEYTTAATNTVRVLSPAEDMFDEEKYSEAGTATAVTTSKTTRSSRRATAASSSSRRRKTPPSSSAEEPDDDKEEEEEEEEEDDDAWNESKRARQSSRRPATKKRVQTYGKENVSQKRQRRTSSRKSAADAAGSVPVVSGLLDGSQQSQSKRKLPSFISSQAQRPGSIGVEEIDDSD